MALSWQNACRDERREASAGARQRGFAPPNCPPRSCQRRSDFDLATAAIQDQFHPPTTKISGYPLPCALPCPQQPRPHREPTVYGWRAANPQIRSRGCPHGIIVRWPLAAPAARNPVLSKFSENSSLIGKPTSGTMPPMASGRRGPLSHHTLAGSSRRPRVASRSGTILV